MKMKKVKRGILPLLCLTAMLSGCDKAREQETAQMVTEIPVTFLVNPDTGENENEDLVEAFNEEYEGAYRLKVEWITDSAEGYRSRIKSLNALDKLPAVITDAGFDADFYSLLKGSGRLTDLKPYMETDSEWGKVLGEREMESFQEEDGTVCLSPSGNASFSYGGFFYNKDLFAQAGITGFPDNWEQFFGCLDILKAKGITPLAIHGGSSYWTPLLMATGYTAGTAEGLAFLETQYPQDYTNESSKALFGMMKRLFDYADKDAVDIERTEAARRFAQGSAAITANGGWMLMNFTEEEKEQIGFAPFPGNVLLEDMRMSAWAVTSGYPEDVTRGAVEFLRFRTLREQRQEEAYFAETAGNNAEKEYKQAVRKVKTAMPNYQLKWEGQIQEEFFVNMLPFYIEGEMSEEEFLTALNREVQAVNAEK